MVIMVMMNVDLQSAQIFCVCNVLSAGTGEGEARGGVGGGRGYIQGFGTRAIRFVGAIRLIMS